MTNKQAVFSASSYKRMEEALSRANLLNDTVETNPVERIAIYNNQNNQMLSILYHLRNSLCHGRFCLFEAKRTKWIALEDVVPRSDPEGAKLSARMVVKYQTLTKWRDLITRGPQ